MEEKMKKMLFLMLFLMILGAASVSAQVRIGGNGVPNPAAVLDLNADNNATGTKGLALPRVSLTDINTALAGSPTVNGMMVYNTNASVGAGIYYWDTNKWIKISDSTFVEGDGVVGNEIADVVTGGGLKRYGSGNLSDPYKVGLDTALVLDKGSLVWAKTAKNWVPSPGPVLSVVAAYVLRTRTAWAPDTWMHWDTIVPGKDLWFVSASPGIQCWGNPNEINCLNLSASTLPASSTLYVGVCGW